MSHLGKQADRMIKNIYLPICEVKKHERDAKVITKYLHDQDFRLTVQTPKVSTQNKHGLRAPLTENAQ